MYKKDTISSIEDLPKGTIGFVYVLTYESGMKYIGRKYIHSVVTLPIRKNGDKRTGLRGYISSVIKPRKKQEVVTKESDWVDYSGSSDLVPLTDMIIHKEILHVCSDKNCISYLEEKELFNRDAVIDPMYYNKSIQRRHFDNAIDGLL